MTSNDSSQCSANIEAFELEALAYGELAAERANQLERHTHDCAVCTHVLVDLQVELSLMDRRRATEPALPPSLWPRMVARLTATPTGVLARWRAAFAVIAVGAVCAAALVAVALGSGRSKLALPPAPSTMMAVAHRPPPPPPGPAEQRSLRALSDAEATQEAALAQLEAAYARTRASLPPARLAVADAQFHDAKHSIVHARAAAGDDVRGRRRLIHANMQVMHSLRRMLFAEVSL